MPSTNSDVEMSAGGGSNSNETFFDFEKSETTSNFDLVSSVISDPVDVRKLEELRDQLVELSLSRENSDSDSDDTSEEIEKTFKKLYEKYKYFAREAFQGLAIEYQIACVFYTESD